MQKRIHVAARSVQTEPVRAKTFNIRFSEEELARLDAVANHYALTAAGLIRMLVKREADAIRARTGTPPENGAAASPAAAKAEPKTRKR